MDSSNRTSLSLKIIIGVIFLISIAALVSSGFLWSKLNQTEGPVALSSEDEIKQIVSEVSAVLTLPQDEEPTLVTLTEADLQAAQNQAFFANAIAGDKLLFYQNNSKAILWRPTAKKVIEASIINTTPAATPTAGVLGE